ncbi:hypothetical protein [Bifidobacterium felsineum]|uniref:hypothetical protein n=1 Tax=Bifidobacterium felsineum TaxID=2045440 RepID=UPI001BDBD3DD|nr:hypothetical protein [Bifidobacterium felsineum]MBT1164621.1 hypothetical protein [Bifidobacterium felsineum]
MSYRRNLKNPPETITVTDDPQPGDTVTVDNGLESYKVTAVDGNEITITKGILSATIPTTRITSVFRPLGLPAKTGLYRAGDGRILLHDEAGYWRVLCDSNGRWHVGANQIIDWKDHYMFDGILPVKYVDLTV